MGRNPLERNSRLKTFDYLGLHRYSLTYCTDWRHRWFVNAAPVELVRTQFLRVAENERFAIVVYCFMPDHVHMLVQGLADDSNGKQFITRSKQCPAHAYAEQFNAKLWQPFGFEHVLRDDEKMQVAAKYILENPVRAGLRRIDRATVTMLRD